MRERTADIAIVLGGDGTMLRALQRYLGSGTAVFGVNFGRVGFLTSVHESELEAGVSRVFAGEHEVVELATVDVEVEGERAVAVNDVVVTSGTLGRMVELDWRVGGEVLGRVPCDGVICATPTGSTAYNLSNGGPVLAWGLDAMAVTFVSPHSLHARPLVAPAEPGGRGLEPDARRRRRRARRRPPPDRADCGRAASPRGSATARRCSPCCPKRRSSGATETRLLRRLRIENLVLIREAELDLAPGLNAITGETGAGKTILSQAIGLLLGARGDAALIGAEGQEAYIEAELDAPGRPARGGRLRGGRSSSGRRTRRESRSRGACSPTGGRVPTPGGGRRRGRTLRRSRSA